MSFFISPDKLPQGSSVTFYDSSFFTRVQKHQPCRLPVFKELGVVVKQSEKSSAIISEGQCLRAVRRFLPEVPVPEVYGWTQENGITFLYMGYIESLWRTVGIKRGASAKSSKRPSPNCLIYVENLTVNSSFCPCWSFSSVTEFHNCMSDMFKWPAKMRQPDLDPADILDPYRESLPDNCPIHFTHADLNPVNIMVSEDSPCRVMAILDWEQSGWYPAYWEFCKAEMTTEFDSEWQTTYLPKVLDEPDCIEVFYSYINAFGP
ncbi:hypothetical protein FCULG_00009022 [Fusarium culmorum]|uniref:Aminoglycoside phosphotransferase domain-containing protein n=2 Tax=Fusarium culmorum TaxID=5516 RepID=A0A2T4GHX4_FUSCU|nr:hypothetical protein FCULG_00009022 [Fusarium culmorum]